MLDVGGQDSTEAFEDVGHSDEAREILEGLLVGNLKRQVCLYPPYALCPQSAALHNPQNPSTALLLLSHPLSFKQNNIISSHLPATPRNLSAYPSDIHMPFPSAPTRLS